MCRGEARCKRLRMAFCIILLVPAPLSKTSNITSTKGSYGGAYGALGEGGLTGDAALDGDRPRLPQ